MRIYSSASSSTPVHPHSSRRKAHPKGPPSIIDVYGVPPEGFLMASLETEDEEEDLEAPDTSRDEEPTHKFFSDLN
jgi:hypothetical protein